MSGDFEEYSPASERRLERVLIVSSIGTALAVVLLFLNVIFSLALMQLSGKFMVLPYLVTDKTRTSDELIIKEVFDRHMTSVKSVTEVYVRKFIETKYGYYNDPSYMRMLWGRVFRSIASKAAYKTLYVDEETFESKINKDKDSSVRVIISNVFRNPKDYHWEVRFSISRVKNPPSMLEEPEVTKERTENLTVSFIRARKNFMGRFINPLGIVVSDENID